MINFEGVKSEKGLRTQIKRNLNKEYHPATKPSIDFIYKILEDAYASGLNYDVTDMRNAVLAFAASSTHQADYCIKLVNKMQFKSADQSAGAKNDDAKLVFYDVEVFPNLFLVNWKIEGEGKPVVRMINPTPTEIEELMRFRLVGFNCRRYDNHILYARLMGYTNEQLYNLSTKIINGSANCFFGEAYNVSYTDVYDFSSKKQSLKKFEIELGIHHQELGLPWDKPVPEELWTKVAEYCDNDVIATEATFNARKADFTARQILADVAGMSVNDTTNSLTTRIIFGNNRKPQDQFNYRFMGDESQIFDPNADLPFTMGLEDYDEFTQFDKNHRPIFPGYTFEGGKSVYRGEEVGEGGYVYSEPGMYSNIALLDIASMHPSSIVAEELFGPEYTKRFNEILQARIAIKHKDFDKAKKMLGGALAKYLTDENAAADLAQALKIAINSVYGLTSAGFENPFRDNRNKDNIVAKRGALFVVNLKHAVQSQGFTVAHIKTDSIKIPDATPEIIKFVTEYGKLYGYNFEHEATYDRMCLVNDAVYIARYATVEKCCDLYGKKYIDSAKDICKENKKHPYAWTATGTQFQIPYVFKTLFSKENIEFEDMCETKSVTSSLYLDMNEALPDVSALEAERDKLWKQITDSKRMTEPMPTECERVEELTDEIAKGHDYHFIGKVGQFCPIKPGCGGGILLRETENKKTGEKGYAAATGSKGFRWLESEMVKQLDKQGDIDRGYYNNMVDEAIKSLSVYGDFERFAADEPYVSDNTPPWFGAGEPHEEDTTPFDVR
ncbi:MAG: hypothetical protein ACLR01_06820 [Vescimonas sp.]